MKPPRFLPEDILAHARPAGVDRIVLVQMSYYRFDNSYMLEVMQDYRGTFSGIAIVDPQGKEPDREMRRLAERGVRGFRIAPWSNPVERWLDGEGYERMFRTGADENLALCPLIGPDGLPALARRCAQFPRTPVIIDHLCRIGAGGPITREDIDRLCAMAQYSSVMVKVSAFYALGRKSPPYRDLAELIRRVRDAFGPERLMWASDSPYQVQNEHTYEASLALIRDQFDFLAPEESAQILRGTAERFFFG
jgi:predicted TIM-barrel fold metal-dependent hydrolase